MASTKASTNNGAESRETALVEAIQRKRQQLDDEIEYFKALKEQEFCAFEARLRKTLGEIDVARVETSLKSVRARIKVGKSTKERKGYEREKEFEGLFTPRFLPLLGGKGEQEMKENPIMSSSTAGALHNWTGSLRMRLDRENERGLMDAEEKALQREDEEMTEVDRGRHDGEEESRDQANRTLAPPTRLQQQREEAKNEIANARRSVQPMLSSSAEYRRSGMTSPPALPARPLSSSVPPEHALDKRRSSSRSDVSIDGLRSSLRSSREPKSPKRVQFSIDDTVVSPSTSPIARRVGVPGSDRTAGQPTVSKGFERFEVLKGQREGKTSSNGIEYSGSGDFSSNAPPIKLNKGDSSNVRSLPPFGDQPHATVPLLSGAEEPFDILDNEEDVFEFDEDIGARASSAIRTSNNEDIIDDEGEPEKGARPSLTGSSPHAGSLPIEIKWGASMRRSIKDD